MAYKFTLHIAYINITYFILIYKSFQLFTLSFKNIALFIRNRNQEKKPIYQSNKKNNILRNKLNQGGKRTVLRKLQNTEERN